MIGLRGDGAGAKRDAALVKLQACVKATPQIAACHYGVGVVTGVQVMTQGMMKAAFGIGQVRDEFAKALEIDPQFFSARNGLVQFYLMVPGIAGGSVSKARDVAQAAVARQPEYAKLLNAAILQYDDKPADAERVLAGVQVGTDASLAEELRGQWIALGFGYLEAKQPARARAVFERVVKDKPDLVEGRYGLGARVERAEAVGRGHRRIPGRREAARARRTAHRPSPGRRLARQGRRGAGQGRLRAFPGIARPESAQCRRREETAGGARLICCENPA